MVVDVKIGDTVTLTDTYRMHPDYGTVFTVESLESEGRAFVAVEPSSYNGYHGRWGAYAFRLVEKDGPW